MDRTERFYRIDQLINNRKLVTTQEFIEELGVSLATFKRDFLYMQNHLHAPTQRCLLFRPEQRHRPEI